MSQKSQFPALLVPMLFALAGLTNFAAAAVSQNAVFYGVGVAMLGVSVVFWSASRKKAPLQ